VREVEGIAAFHAQMSLADGRIEHGLYLHDASVARADIHFASDSAVGARCPCPIRRNSMFQDGLVLQCASRACIDTRAATDAGAGEQGRSIGHDARVVPTTGDMPDKLSLHLVADPHAAEAVDAARHVGSQIRMSEIRKPRAEARRNIEIRIGFGSRASGFFGISDFGFRTYPVMPHPPMKLLFRPALHGFRWVLLRQQFEQRAPSLLNLGRVRFNLHPVIDGCGAGGDELVKLAHLDEAKPARARGFEAVIVAKGWNFRARQAAGIKDRGMGRRFNSSTVDDESYHASRWAFTTRAVLLASLWFSENCWQ